MAEVLLARRAQDRGIAAVVESARIAALVGHEADPIAQTLVGARGLDLRARHHRHPHEPEADGRESITRDAELAVEQLCRHVRDALSRIEKDEAAERIIPIEVVVMDAALAEQRSLSRVAGAGDRRRSA